MRAPLHTTLVLLLGACQATGTPDPQTSATPAAGTGSAWSCSPRVELSSVWSFLAGKYDLDDNGRVTAREYTRGEQRFGNYDRDGDGVLTEKDFPPDTFFNGFSHMLVGMADGDRDGEITDAEWRSFGERLDADADGDVQQSEAKAVMGEWADDWPLFLLSFDQDSDGDFDRTDLELTFRDQDFDGDGTLVGRETRGWMPTAERQRAAPPAAGEEAPDFELPHAEDPSRSFRLADAVGRKPIALVFGSYT